MTDSRLIGMEMTEREPSDNPLYRPNRYPKRGITVKWTFGSLSGIIDEENPVLMPPPPGKKSPPPFLDQEAWGKEVEQLIRGWLASVYKLDCMKDCGDIGLCKTHCSRYIGGFLFGSEAVIDRYRPTGTLREATDDELKDVAWCAWIDSYMAGERLENTMALLLGEINLNADNDRIVEAMGRVKSELGRRHSRP